MPKTVPSSAVFFRHNPYKIYTHCVWINPMLLGIKKCCTAKGSPLCDAKSIEWMPMKIINSVSNFDNNRPPSITRDDIYFSSFYLIVPRDDEISGIDEVPTGDILSRITDRSSRSSYTSFHKIIVIYY